MLSQVLHEIKTSDGALNMGYLEQKLGVERSALNGMIQFLVQTGHLIDEDALTDGCSDTTGSCGSSCTGLAECTFVAKMPKTYALSKREDK